MPRHTRFVVIFQIASFKFEIHLDDGFVAHAALALVGLQAQEDLATGAELGVGHARGLRAVVGGVALDLVEVLQLSVPDMLPSHFHLGGS